MHEDPGAEGEGVEESEFLEGEIVDEAEGIAVEEEVSETYANTVTKVTCGCEGDDDDDDDDGGDDDDDDNGGDDDDDG